MKTRTKKIWLSITLLSLLLTAFAAHSDASRIRNATLTETRMTASPSPQHNGKKFQNPALVGPDIQNGWGSMLSRYIFGEEQRRPGKPLPQKQPNLAALMQATEGIQAIWVSHSTVLLNIEGTIILTDPVFSKSVSPVPLMGPSRFTPQMTVHIEDLPKIDIVLLSHDHYDHLDKVSIQALNSKTTRFIAPLGVDGHLLRWGISASKITVLDWWEQATASGVTLHALPAQHFSGRGVFDRNSTLWASWAIVGTNSRVFFGGDTGYHEGFKEIGDKLGPFDLTMLECGAYSKHWPDIHMQPEEAARAHLELKGKVLMPIHWATFNLSLHDWFEPIERLKNAAGPDVNIATPMQGELFEVGPIVPQTAWWRSALQAKEAEESSSTEEHGTI